jgi:hypothetical protein
LPRTRAEARAGARESLRSALGLGLACLGLGGCPAAPAPDARDPWARLPGILARIEEPVFPARDFAVTDFGADPAGASDSSEAFRAAIAACAAAGVVSHNHDPGCFSRT